MRWRRVIPSHDPDLRARLTDIALKLGLLRTGGSDWHGDPGPGVTHGTIGSQAVPREWLDRLDEFAGPLAESRGVMSLLQPGSVAPDFTAAASDGRTYSLRRAARRVARAAGVLSRQQHPRLKPPTLRRAR